MPLKVERRDTNTLVFDIFQQATGQKPWDDAGKNPAAAALGRRGEGLKGAAQALTPEKRAEVPKKAARNDGTTNG